MKHNKDKKTLWKTAMKSLLIGATALSLTACGAASRVANIGAQPDMSSIDDADMRLSQKPVRLPMPKEIVQERNPNSIWQTNRTTFFEDQRANEIGDILTVIIEINEEAAIENETTRSRSSNEDAQAPSFLGYEAFLDEVFAEGIDASDLINFGQTSNYTGGGEIEREEEITMRMAAMVTQMLPNGNLIIHGKQELLVNFEKRILQVDGVIRPEDISVSNTINYDQIAQARFVYGGEGQITDVQQPRYGQQLYDIIFPF